MKKLLSILVVSLTAMPIMGQALGYTPPAYAAYISSDGSTWNAWTSALGSSPLPYTPQAIGLYCQATSSSPWTPCAPSIGLGTAATQNTGTSGANVPLLNGANTSSGAQTYSANGAASTPEVTWTGTPFTGGSGTTTFPLLYYNCLGSAAPTTFSTSGTILGFNTCSGAVNIIDIHSNGGGSVFSLASSGTMALAAGVQTFIGSSSLNYPNGASSGFVLSYSATGSAAAVTSQQANAANTGHIHDFKNSSSVVAFVGNAGGASFPTYSTSTNCSSAASPAVCGSAAAGAVLIPIGTTSSTLTVNTTAVTATSQIFFYPDDTLGATLGVTCNSTLATLVGGSAITARTPAASFTITFNGTILTNGVCGSYFIIN